MLDAECIDLLLQARPEGNAAAAQQFGPTISDMQRRAAELFGAEQWQLLVPLCGELAKLAPDALVFAQAAHPQYMLGKTERAVSSNISAFAAQ